MWNYCFEHADQVEHAHDNPLDEITLGEGGTSASAPLEEVPVEKPVTPKRIYWEVEGNPERKCGLDVDPRVEEEKEIKKEGKKEKSKGEIAYSWAVAMWSFCEASWSRRCSADAEENNEKETKEEKNKERKEKKTKKKDKVKESEELRKPNKTSKQERKSNFSDRSKTHFRDDSIGCTSVIGALLLFSVSCLS